MSHNKKDKYDRKCASKVYDASEVLENPAIIALGREEGKYGVTAEEMAWGTQLPGKHIDKYAHLGPHAEQTAPQVNPELVNKPHNPEEASNFRRPEVYKAVMGGVKNKGEGQHDRG